MISVSSCLTNRQLKGIFPLFLLLFLLIGCGDAAGQSKNLPAIRREIDQLEIQLKRKQAQERSVLEQLQDLDREIGLRRKLLSALNSEKQETEQAIRLTEKEYKQSVSSLERLKELVAGRMVAMYKRGRIADWEVLLSMNSINQAMVWQRYQKKIIENDERNLRLLDEKRETVNSQRQVLQKQLAEKQRLINETNEAARSMESKKQNRNELLKQHRQDIQQIEEKIRRMQQVYKEIEIQISREEARRKATTKSTITGNFALQKGKLEWPVQGRVVSRFGRQRHPVSKTWFENMGIDIETDSNEAVRVVAGGKVISKSWQRDVQNLVIIDHGSGYYTVYGFLDVVWVEPGENVDAHAIIGQVGDSESLNGSKLKFYIWKGAETENPEGWLK